MEALCAVGQTYVAGESLGLRPLLRITADWPKYAKCAAAHIAYLGPSLAYTRSRQQSAAEPATEQPTVTA